MLNNPNLALILRPQAASFFKPDTHLSFTADITAAAVRKAVLLNTGGKSYVGTTPMLELWDHIWNVTIQ